MKKKILFVIDSLGCGGAEKSLISLLSLLDYDKYDVDLQLYNPSGMFKKLVPKDVNILPNLKFYDFINLPFYRQICSLKFNKIISKLKFSYLVRNNKENLHGAQIFWENCGKQVDCLNKEYDVAVAYNQGFSTYFVAEKVIAKKKLAWVNTDYIKAGYRPNIDNKFYSKFDNIVAVSNEVKNVLENCFIEFKEKIVVVNDINNAELIEKMSKFTNPFSNVEKDTIKIVTVGRLVKLKGYDLALEACSILNETTNLKFKWYIVGEGLERKNIEKSIVDKNLQDKFILLGAKDNPYPYIKNADIYVQTSRFEGFGLAIAEARILNTPVVTTNFDAVYNQMINGKNGLVVDLNGEAIANGISELIKNKELKNNIIKYLINEKKGNIEELEKFYKIIK